MSSSCSELISVEFLNIRNTSCQAKVNYSNDYNRNYVGLYKETKYINEASELKQSRNYVLYTITQLNICTPDLVKLSKTLNNSQVCNISEINSWSFVS